MNSATLQWQSPEPLWARFGPATPAAVSAPDQTRPALLRFASDAFMDQMLATLAQDPAAIGALLARPETWRSPPSAVAGPAADPAPDPAAEHDRLRRLSFPGLIRAAGRGLAQGGKRTALTPVPDIEAREERHRDRELPLKLFQPAHQRYYLLGASLVCGQFGLPDRAVTRGGAEQVGFVLRRLLSAPDDVDGPLHEHAFVPNVAGARWQRVSADDQDAVLCPGEEVLPLFPLAFRDGVGHSRTLWSGLIPVGRREEYLGTAVQAEAQTLLAAQLQALAGTAAPDVPDAKRARLAQFQTEIAEPWKALIQSVYQAKASLDETLTDADETDEERADRIARLNQQWQMHSWLILIDFADFLRAHLPGLWRAMTDGPPPAAGSPARALYDWLGSATNSSALENVIGSAPTKSVASSLRAALVQIAGDTVRDGLEQVEILYSDNTKNDAHWPGFHFLLAGLDNHVGANGPDPAVAGACTALGPPLPNADGIDDLIGLLRPPATIGGAGAGPGQAEAAEVDSLTAAIALALDDQPAETWAPPLPFALQVRDALAATGGAANGWMIARCVHVDADCGPLVPPTLSAPSQRFQLASYFDPDAPARPIRITLPTDTTPAGLRRHQRGTAFVISDILCGQIQRAKGLGLVDLVRSVLPWPLHKDLDLGSGGKCGEGSGLDIGMICSLSIPIITICALILLIIMVTLLDIIFRWLPYLIFCFPLPGLKGKGAGS